MRVCSGKNNAHKRKSRIWWVIEWIPCGWLYSVVLVVVVSLLKWNASTTTLNHSNGLNRREKNKEANSSNGASF